MVIRKLLEIFLFIVLTEGCCLAIDYPSLETIEVDLGDNLTLPCHGNGEENLSDLDLSSVMWVREGRNDKQINRLHIEGDGSFLLTDIDKDDSGIYTCFLELDQSRTETNAIHIASTGEDVKSRFQILVRTPPAALVNVTVVPSSSFALLLWDVGDNGGYEITHFTAQYRQLNVEPPDEWHLVVPNIIRPTVRQIDIYHLNPNSTYAFQIWANNVLGEGDLTLRESTTLHDNAEIELARHLLVGAENFDTRVWVAAVAVVMGTLIMLAAGTCYLLYKECNLPTFPSDDQEIIELVPNIILNPGFYETEQTDENSNETTPIRVNSNNNTLMRPMRV